MSSSWFDSIDDDDTLTKVGTDAFYCPYTNSARCALLAKGWQPQELCLDLECEQMKVVLHNRSARRRNKAA